MLGERELARIYTAWKEFEAEGINVIEPELQRLIKVSNTYYNIATRHFGDYIVAYDHYAKNENTDFVTLNKFLEAVKSVSQEAYESITEGHDIINFITYISFHKRKVESVDREVIRLTKFVSYFAHAILRILNEPNEDKKQIMLRGLIGM